MYLTAISRRGALAHSFGKQRLWSNVPEEDERREGFANSTGKVHGRKGVRVASHSNKGPGPVTGTLTWSSGQTSTAILSSIAQHLLEACVQNPGLLRCARQAGEPEIHRMIHRTLPAPQHMPMWARGARNDASLEDLMNCMENLL